MDNNINSNLLYVPTLPTGGTTSSRCPSCGYCPHCGRSNPNYNQYPIFSRGGTAINSIPCDVNGVTNLNTQTTASRTGNLSTQ